MPEEKKIPNCLIFSLCHYAFPVLHNPLAQLVKLFGLKCLCCAGQHLTEQKFGSQTHVDTLYYHTDVRILGYIVCIHDQIYPFF